jgi:glycerophosphoryl diester phosphodiesterase
LTQQGGQGVRGLGRGAIRQRILDVYSGLRGRFSSMFRFALAFELLRWLVLAPLSAGVLSFCLGRWGRCSVGNFEIITFLLSPPGVTALLVVGTVALTGFYLELAGLILLLADRHAAWWSSFPALGRILLPLLGLGLRQLLILIALAVPSGGAIAAALKLIWTGHDLNGLIVLKPPVFWYGVAAAAGLGATYALIGGYLSLRWLLALPAVIFEPGTRSSRAMRLSAERTRGRIGSIACLVISWLVAVAAVSGVLLGAVHLASGWVLNRTGDSLSVVLPVTAAVLIINGLLAALLSIVGSAGLASLVLALYRQAVGVAVPVSEPRSAAGGPGGLLSTRWRVAGIAAVLLASVSVVCYTSLARVRLHENLEITAHRGGAAVAPENTVAAIRKAIEARADWAEIDVQLTADGAIVVVHDSDLLRIGGVPQRVSDSTLSQIKSIDVGSRFGAEFRGERIATLDEVITAAGEKIRLNIELKPHKPEDVGPLVQAVVDAVRRAGITRRCRVCSQSYEGLQLARQLEPELQLGFIAGGRLGDLSGLDVNYLMVAGHLATRSLSQAARLEGIEVHAWTINDTAQLAPLLDRGTDNIITDDPAAMRRRLEEVQELSPAERLLLRARNFLAA